MEDANTQMTAMQAQFEETIAKLHEDFTAKLRVLEASNKTMWYSWYGGQRRDDGRDDGMVFRDGGMPRQQQLQQHWSCDGGMPRQQQQQQHWSRGGGMPRQQQQQQQWSRGGGIPHQHQRSSHVFPSARQARQQQPLQQPSRGVPTIGGDGEDRSTPFLKLFLAVMARLLRSVFNRAIWRCRCSPCRRDRSSRRRRQWHLLQQHLRLKQ